MKRRVIVLRETTPTSAPSPAPVPGGLAPAGAVEKGTTMRAAGAGAAKQLPLSIEFSDASEAQESKGPKDQDEIARSGTIPISNIVPLPGATLAASAVKGETVGEAKANKITWGVKTLKADLSTMDGSGVTMAVLDTGIRSSHQAFSHLRNDGRLVEKDFTGAGDGDTDGHGTHCAGTVFGGEVDGVRIGMAPNVERALIAKVLGGNSDSGDVIDAIKWALDEGAQIISMSLSFDFVTYREALAQTHLAEAATSMALTAYRDNIRLFDSFMDFARQRQHEALFVAATGNQSSRPDYSVEKASPSASHGVIGVGALGLENGVLSVAPFSNKGAHICAPGVGVVSAGIKDDAELVTMSGTSMATPHVAGLAALYWQQRAQMMPSVKPSDIRSALETDAAMTRTALFADAAREDIGLGMPSAPA